MAESIDPLEAETGWRLRPALLAALGLAAGLAVHAILGEHFSGRLAAWQAASAAFVTVAAGLIAVTLERSRAPLAIGFSLGAGLVAALVFYWNGDTASWSATEGWRSVSLFLSLAIAAPLFQAARDAGALRLPYHSVHDHVWTNVLLWCAAWAFVGVCFLLVLLLGELFHLVGIDWLRTLLRKQWFDFALLGASFGAGTGLFREREAVIRLAQRVVAMVFSVLAPVLGTGLLLFLVALVFTGLQPLWDATKSTTPILLACVIGSLVLINTVIADAPEHEPRNPLLRWGALALALAVLPLAGIANVATWLRIGQYGYTPERLWAATFDAIAMVYGAAYLVAIVRGRLRWAERARPANLGIALLICGVALVLATPIVSFNAISTRDQLARLESGKVKPEKFDWAALAFDFGEPGRRALERLAASRDPVVGKAAKEAAGASSRWELYRDPIRDESAAAKKTLASRMRVLPGERSIPEGLVDLLVKPAYCGDAGRCTLLFTKTDEAILFNDSCIGELSQRAISSIDVDFWAGRDCTSPRYFRVVDGKWLRTDANMPETLEKPRREAIAKAFAEGRIEVRPVQRRQVFIGGEPVGAPFP